MNENEKIRCLRAEAGAAGDLEQVALCTRALASDASARDECLRVIATAAAMEDAFQHMNATRPRPVGGKHDTSIDECLARDRSSIDRGQHTRPPPPERTASVVVGRGPCKHARSCKRVLRKIADLRKNGSKPCENARWRFLSYQ